MSEHCEKSRDLGRRRFLELAGGAGVGALAARSLPPPVAWGASAVSGAMEEERAINGAKATRRSRRPKWKDVIKRVGPKRLAPDLATYKAAMLKVDIPI